MSIAKFVSVQPTLPTRDMAAAIRFYTERLGFTLAFQDSPTEPHYAGLRRGAVELHLQWHDPAEWTRVERPMLRFVIDDLQALFDEYAAAGVTKPGDVPRQTDWGTWEFAFYDLDLNGLTFYRDLQNTPL